MPGQNKVYITLEVDDKGSGQVQKADKNLNSAFDRIKRGSKAASGKMAKHWKSAGRSVLAGFKRLKKGVFGLKAALVALAGAAGAGLLAKSFLNTASSMEQYKITLGTVLRSHEKAKEYMKWIQKFAASTPFEIPGLVEAATRLEAYGLNAKKHMTTLGDTAAAMGKPIMSAVEMIADASQGEFERMKEFGLRASDVAKKAGFKSVTEMTSTRDNLVKGTETLMAMLEERYSGGMKGLSKSWGGMVSNLSDYWTQFKQKVMESGIFEFLKTNLSALLTKIGELKSKGKLDEWAKKTASVVLKSFRAINNGIGFGIKIAETAAVAFTFAWENIKQTFEVDWVKKHVTEPLKESYGWMKKVLKDAKEFYFGREGEGGLLGDTTPKKTRDAIAEVKEGFAGLTKGVEFFREGIDKAIASVDKLKDAGVETQGRASLPAPAEPTIGVETQGLASLPAPAEPTVDVVTGMFALAEQQYQARLRLQEEFSAVYHEMVTSTYDLEREKIEEQVKIWEAAGADKISVAEWAENEITRINREQNLSRLQFAQQAAGGIAETFRQIAEAGGKQSKEAFMIYKAAAMTEAGIASAIAIMQVWGDPTIPSTIAKGIMAGIIALKMGVQMSMIAGASPPSYDEGGVSRQPGIYYAGVPEAHIPLKGGSVPVEMKQEQRPQEITILNAVSPAMLDAYLATPRGKNAIFNLMGQAPSTVKRRLR